jgi:Na+-translocating ferredoxin:NAD+ oxidoreductase RnfG subunit
MKRYLPFAVGISILSLAASTGISAESLAPGQVDFGKFSPPGAGGTYVEVNLSNSLIGLAARFVEKEEPEVARLLRDVQLVHVNVIGLNDGNRDELEKRTQKIRKELDSKGWEHIVTAQKDEQNVGIYLKTRNKDTIQGVVVLVTDSKEAAVFVNIVGDIKPEQLAMLGEKLHIDPLKKAGDAIEKSHDAEKGEKGEK